MRRAGSQALRTRPGRDRRQLTLCIGGERPRDSLLGGGPGPLPCLADSGTHRKEGGMTPTEVIELSGERDLAMQARLAAYRAGYAAAADEAWSAGYAHAIAEVKAAQHGLVLLVGELAGIEAARWMVRGE